MFNLYLCTFQNVHYFSNSRIFEKKKKMVINRVNGALDTSLKNIFLSVHHDHSRCISRTTAVLSKYRIFPYRDTTTTNTNKISVGDSRASSNEHVVLLHLSIPCRVALIVCF